MSCFVFQLRTGFDRVVRGLWARALFAGPFAMLRRGGPKKGTRNPTRLATRREIFVLPGAHEPSEAGRGPAVAGGPGLVPHSR